MGMQLRDVEVGEEYAAYVRSWPGRDDLPQLDAVVRVRALEIGRPPDETDGPRLVHVEVISVPGKDGHRTEGPPFVWTEARAYVTSGTRVWVRAPRLARTWEEIARNAQTHEANLRRYQAQRDALTATIDTILASDRLKDGALRMHIPWTAHGDEPVVNGSSARTDLCIGDLLAGLDAAGVRAVTQLNVGIQLDNAQLAAILAARGIDAPLPVVTEQPDLVGVDLETARTRIYEFAHALTSAQNAWRKEYAAKIEDLAVSALGHATITDLATLRSLDDLCSAIDRPLSGTVEMMTIPLGAIGEPDHADSSDAIADALLG